MVRIGGLEAGGTKMVCAVADAKGQIVARETYPTKTPEETLPQLVQFFKEQQIDALGIGSFGPVHLQDDNYGVIGNTPKIPWIGVSLYRVFADELNIPVKITTDVNAAAYAEHQEGAAKGLDSCLYITVGTGIGAGAIMNGNVMQGFSHPEMGHIQVKRNVEDNFEGICPYHKDCLEGMASGPAIEARWGKKGSDLSERADVWSLQSDYLGQALAQYTFMLMPEKIIIGGGVMNQPEIMPKVRQAFLRHLGGYVDIPSVASFIVSPGLKGESGARGAILLGNEAYNE
ncbi:ROK family protein [Geomicrobium sp. JCM 19039]|uniref:ROK family protein n=1 Tax=Geomicrobium sp. JCM 19039 TaxID=1460636 RepID=UPI00045F3CC4|nr:ROK family protein [Geomicrobium sp. JCM 19039]GAK14167.1 fructokinase [Geomicrobium sp. JCM 19039]